MRTFATHSFAFALLTTVAHPSPLASVARGVAHPDVVVRGVTLGADSPIPRADQLLCTVVIETLGCEGVVEADEYPPTRVTDLCPGPCAKVPAASPTALIPALRRLDENATDDTVWCKLAPDRASFDLMGPTGCMQNLPETFPGEHARRNEKVNAMMAETAEEPLHWALAYSTTLLLTCCSAFCSSSL